jgi:hypothetical protein
MAAVEQIVVLISGKQTREDLVYFLFKSPNSTVKKRFDTQTKSKFEGNRQRKKRESKL